jgi:hypothetical protein
MASLRFATIAIGGVIIDIAGTVIGTAATITGTGITGIITATGTIVAMDITVTASVTFGMGAAFTISRTSISIATYNTQAPFSLRGTGKNPRGPVACTPL